MTVRPTSRDHPGYWAFLAHRLSGVAIAIFLPMHFLALALALEGASALNGFLALTERPAVKVAEWGLVVALGVHLGLGARLLVLELHPWRGLRKAWIGWAAGLALGVGVLFAVSLAG